MPAKSVFCTEGLTPRVIAPNEYQLVSADERDAAIRRHFDQLSTFLQKADRQRATNRQDNIVVQSLFNTKRGKHGADNGVVTEPKSRDRDDRRGGADGGKRPTGSDAAARPKTASTREKDRPGPSAEETVGARQPANTPNLVDRKDDIVHLKSMAKLKKLCYMLRTNVVQLKEVYENRSQLGYEFTESEVAKLGSGLQSLEANVQRLLGTVDAISGFRDEIQDTVKTYTGNERAYRRLRSIKKNAKLRNKSVHDEDRNGGRRKMNMCELLKHLVLCNPCRRMFG